MSGEERLIAGETDETVEAEERAGAGGLASRIYAYEAAKTVIKKPSQGADRPASR